MNNSNKIYLCYIDSLLTTIGDATTATSLHSIESGNRASKAQMSIS